MGSPYLDDGSFYNHSLCQLMAYPIQAAHVIRAQPETSALGQEQTSRPAVLDVRFGPGADIRDGLVSRKVRCP